MSSLASVPSYRTSAFEFKSIQSRGKDHHRVRQMCRTWPCRPIFSVLSADDYSTVLTSNTANLRSLMRLNQASAEIMRFCSLWTDHAAVEQQWRGLRFAAAHIHAYNAFVESTTSIAELYFDPRSALPLPVKFAHHAAFSLFFLSRQGLWLML